MNNGFKILETRDLPELKAKGIWAKHEKTGAEVFHVLNDDSENLFSFTFTTTPEDDTGVPHILEHSVLCGSERYPLKEAFIVLAQGSLQTFLNAVTFPDKTVYPASSTNEHDYFNLMSVYGNAVFRPLLPEWTFMQEGHRFEYVPSGRAGEENDYTGGQSPANLYDKDGKLTITGVVYNEMKGAYSSLDTYAGHWSAKAIMPNTPYYFESGGDPEHITELTWEDFKEFHRTRYSPANCKIFLAGNIPTEKQLDFLNEEFFSKLEGGKAYDPIKLTERWSAPKSFNIPCPAGSECKSTIYLTWLCNDVTDINEDIALTALTEILLGHDGSPLTRALIESGLGEDITPVSGLESEIRETFFVAGLKGVDGDIKEKSKEIEDLIFGVFKKLYEDGIPKEEIEAALLSMEFSQKEIKRSGGPFSLVWMRRSLRAWLHGGKPWETLLLDPALVKVKENLAHDKRYFEGLIKKYFLDNPHRALVVIEPKEDFLPKQEEKLAAYLAEKEKTMSAAERESIIEKNKVLQKVQNEPDSPEALASIPHLSREDLSKEVEIIDRKHEDLNGVPALCHDLFTNGITYTELAFPVDVLTGDDYLWLPFFSRAVVSVGIPGMNYAEVSSLLARTVGGFNAILHTASAVPGTEPHLKTASGNFDLAGRDWLVFRLKCLDDKIAPSYDLALRLISEADFTDHRRIKDLVLEMKTELSAGLAPMGHIYASGRAGRLNSRSKKTGEMWTGLTQIEFVYKLAEMDIPTVAAKLEQLRQKITDAGLIANVTGGGFKTACSELKTRFSRFGAPKQRAEVSSVSTTTCEAGSREVFASPSMQVGFAARATTAAQFDTMQQIAETVLAHQFSTGVLWETIRMKGGAYGAFASSDSLEGCVSLATYRDPTPLNSLNVFSEVLKDSSHGACDEDYLVKSIIGCYSKEKTPRTGAENGFIDFNRFLYGVTDDYRQRRLERLVSVSVKDIADVFASLGARKSTGTVIIAGTKIAEEAAKKLDVEARVLPV